MMRPLTLVVTALVVVSAMALASCRTSPVGVKLDRPQAGQLSQAGSACWGQATKVFARMGEMGEHASQEPTPREGLRNLARYLYEQGVIEDDTMEALGKFVSDALGLSIDACT